MQLLAFQLVWIDAYYIDSGRKTITLETSIQNGEAPGPFNVDVRMVIALGFAMPARLQHLAPAVHV